VSSARNNAIIILDCAYLLLIVAAIYFVNTHITHTSKGDCVETIHAIGWFDDGRCYHALARPEQPINGAYRCVCPKAGGK